jgi:threonylcarbamoyladenosine tRNA methylthiotransferase MtaB
MKRVAIATLGCKTNQFESAAISEKFTNAGYAVVPFTQSADIYVVNSCTVTARTDAETRRLIRRARRLNPQARIIATGCYAQVAPGELEQMPELDSVLGNQEKQDIIGLVETGESRVSDIATERTSGPLRLESFAEHTRAFLQVQNGCNSFCSYCIVPFARGRSRSVPCKDVLQGIRDLTGNGYREVVLTGIHLGAYGLDLTPPATLTDLVQRIDVEQLVQRLRIGSIEPNEISAELLALMTKSEIICPHLHLPLQSGSDNVLQRMGRRYTAGFFRELVARISATLPQAFIGADVIAGFPGESEDEFNETLQLIEELPFSDLHVFPYSSRPGTKAAKMPGQVPGALIKHRAELLRNCATKKKAAFLAQQVGCTLQVLIQGYDDNKQMCKGISSNYVSVHFPGLAESINTNQPVMVTDIVGEYVIGHADNV